MWWDLKQLIEQVRVTISVFVYTHPSCVGVFMFDRSSAHEGFAENALNVNMMNLNPGGKQKKLHDMVIPINNPDPAPGKEDMRRKVQHMCFPEDHETPQLRGQPKGIKAVLEERKSVWSKYNAICKARGTKVVKKCTQCTKFQVHKDVECCITKTEEMEQQGDMPPTDETAVLDVEEPSAMVTDNWCHDLFPFASCSTTCFTSPSPHDCYL